MLVRTWNLFHGNTVPPGRRAFLREMIELVTADRPDIVCLQEVPAWALLRIGEWADMRPVTALTMPARIGPLRIPPPVGRALTAPHRGLLRSAFAGQGNVILLASHLEAGPSRMQILNSGEFCVREGKRLGLPPAILRAWSRQRRVAQIVAVGGFQLANVHCTSLATDDRPADLELDVAASLLGEATAILAGDFNVTPGRSETIRRLTSPAGGFSGPGPRIDHILVRGAQTSPPRVWPDEEREYAGRLLSDHAPVELTIQS